jgi:fimbrial chaperone protein
VLKTLRTLFLAACLVTSPVVGAQQAQAFSVQPPRSDLTLGKAATVVVDNTDGKKPLTYEAKILRRIVNPDGTWKIEDTAASDFVMVPPTGIVAPGSSQAIRVQFVGNIADKSLHYYLNVKELSVDVENIQKKDLGNGVTASIKLAFAYNVGINVYPPSSEKKLTIVSATGGKKTDKGEPAVELVIDNSGGKHAYLDDYTLEFDGGVKITPQDMQKVPTTPLLPGMMKRTIVLPVSKPLPATAVKARLN